jgi:microsomal epoxide hydrolase
MPFQSFYSTDGQVRSSRSIPNVALLRRGVNEGSPLEFLDLLDLVRAKYSDSELPYTFIVPSLPGYGFSSDIPMKACRTCESMASAVDQLMVGLGFGDGYIAQGGDIGEFL